ncbi:hypothetical protein [Morganella morganii]|uniref:hypothetical protein n=1 Tax=Morganella morganii TaxID=582 RepID=UPI001FFCCC6B|nr:hypothetical protein [Morganella morganii]
MDKKNQGTTMNYQVVPYWLYSGRAAFFILLAVLTGFSGMNAFLLWLLFYGIVWQLVVSLRLHTLKEKGLVSRSHDISHWIVYVYSIPVKEERAILKNPCFALEQNMKDFFFPPADSERDYTGWLYCSAAGSVSPDRGRRIQPDHAGRGIIRACYGCDTL